MSHRRRIRVRSFRTIDTGRTRFPRRHLRKHFGRIGRWNRRSKIPCSHVFHNAIFSKFVTLCEGNLLCLSLLFMGVERAGTHFAPHGRMQVRNGLRRALDVSRMRSDDRDQGRSACSHLLTIITAIDATGPKDRTKRSKAPRPAPSASAKNSRPNLRSSQTFGHVLGCG
jgi:hypothetical protein